MNCKHNGLVSETLHWGFIVRCQICRRIRLRRRDDIFWKVVKIKRRKR